MNTPTEVIDALIQATSVVVVSHYNPDGDAYGSSIGLTLALQAMGKSVVLCNETGIMERYGSIPGIQQVQKSIPLSSELVVICDCGTLNRVGDTLLSGVKSGKKTINIDHHISNDRFADINYVVENASSTSEIIFELLEDLKVSITTDIANCLMTGIVGDTGSFRYSATTARTFIIAAELTKLGAKVEKIYKELYASPTLGSIKLQSEAILGAQILFNGQYAEVLVTHEMLTKNGAQLEDTDGLAEKARDIGGIKISSSIRQDGHIWRVSLRSVDQKYNVSDLAAVFGGGGHRQAAAFRSSKKLETIQELLRTQVQKVLGDNK